MDALPLFYYEPPRIDRMRGRITDRSAGGELRTRVMFDDAQYEIELTTEVMPTAEKDALLAFYEAHLAEQFLFTTTHEASPRVFVVTWLSEPEEVHEGGPWWSLRLRFGGTLT